MLPLCVEVYVVVVSGGVLQRVSALDVAEVDL